MEYFQNIVAEWLVADGRTLVAEEFYLPIRGGAQWFWPDILAVRLYERSVWLCEVTWNTNWTGKILPKIRAYHENEQEIRQSLAERVGIGSDWKVTIWYFVPERNINPIADRLPPGMQVKMTSLEAIRPWSYTHGTRTTGDLAGIYAGRHL